MFLCKVDWRVGCVFGIFRFRFRSIGLVNIRNVTTECWLFAYIEHIFVSFPFMGHLLISVFIDWSWFMPISYTYTNVFSKMLKSSARECNKNDAWFGIFLLMMFWSRIRFVLVLVRKLAELIIIVLWKSAHKIRFALAEL